MHNDIKKALDVLHQGGVILYPTDTIWGLGCDATNEEAIDKIYKIKERINSKSMLVLMANMMQIDRYVTEVPDITYDLIELSEKPLTIIYSGAKNLPKNLIAEDGTIGIRVTNEKFTSQLLQRFRRPIISTSANKSGDPSPQFFDEISDEIKSAVDYVVEYRQDDYTKAEASSIVKIGLKGEIAVIRK